MEAFKKRVYIIIELKKEKLSEKNYNSHFT